MSLWHVTFGWLWLKLSSKSRGTFSSTRSIFCLNSMGGRDVFRSSTRLPALITLHGSRLQSLVNSTSSLANSSQWTINHVTVPKGNATHHGLGPLAQVPYPYLHGTFIWSCQEEWHTLVDRQTLRMTNFHIIKHVLRLLTSRLEYADAPEEHGM